MARLSIAFFLLIGTTAFAQAAGTAQQLYGSCKSNSQQAQLLCSVYLSGIAGVMIDVGQKYDGTPSGPQTKWGLCKATPEGAELQTAFIAWMDKNPTHSDDDPLEAAEASFANRWPCKAAPAN